MLMIHERATCQRFRSSIIGRLLSEMADEHETLLPIANVGRIMKKILPPRAKISKEAKETMQECTTEFISFVTGEASDKCHKDNRRTVNGNDICWALSALGFDSYAEATLMYLYKYREFERRRINQSKASNHEDGASNYPFRARIDCINSDRSDLKPEKQSETPITFEFGVLEKG